jgi:hypothetical protein
MKMLLAAALAALALSTPAAAQDSPLSGAWRLSAKVASVPFHLICTFEQMGGKLSGNCVDPSGRKDLPLTAGSVEGDHVAFTHRGSFLLNKFDVNYAGVRDGDRITGHIDVFGHSGDFVAVRDAG